MHRINEISIGSLTTRLFIDTLLMGTFLNIADDGTLSVDGEWWNVDLPLSIGCELVAAARIDRSTDDTLLGRVKIFRLEDLVWRNEDPCFDAHAPKAKVEFSLPPGFKPTEDNLTAHSHGSANKEFAEDILYELIVQARNEGLITD